jgi:hypothetical protein
VSWTPKHLGSANQRPTGVPCPVCKRPMKRDCALRSCLILECTYCPLLWNPVTRRASAVRRPEDVVPKEA